MKPIRLFLTMLVVGLLLTPIVYKVGLHIDQLENDNAALKSENTVLRFQRDTYEVRAIQCVDALEAHGRREHVKAEE